MKYQNLLFGQNPYFVSCVYNSYAAHCHSEIELLYCVQGEIKVIIEGEEYNLVQGSILLISSLAMHEIIIEEKATALVLELGSQFLGTEYNHIALHKFTKCHITPTDDLPYKSRLIKPLKRLYKEYINRNTGYQWVIQGILFEVFAMVVRCVPMEKQSTQKQKNLESYIKIQKVFDLVHEKYNEEITLERAASYAGYDPRAFCRLFKLITNTTFHDYLNFHRINISIHLLQNKIYSIGEIGEMVGIPVAKTFSRVFRKYIGMTPREYRNMYFEKLHTENIL